MHAIDAEAFKGNDRFAVRRLLGGGKRGVVYEGFDRKRRAVVAVKALRSFGSTALYRLKQEFRSLADLSHPNLVSLYELVGSDDGWFITMEMVHGVDFQRYLRGEPSDQGPPSLPDLDRLRDALQQLLAGVAALHAAAKLHRDIKPSNVLVTREGRVVLVDFGLVYDADRAASELSRVDTVMGTAAYLAPEVLLRGSAPTPASDLYAVGVMLFQALTGRLPFGGSVIELLRAKQERDAPRPSALLAGVPADLDDLCADLLARDPSRRPTVAQALQRLGHEAAQLPLAPAVVQQRIEGREAERRLLQEAYQTTTLGRAVVAVVRGASGLGKTAVVEHFLRELRRGEAVTILRGRCHERESVPFKAFDVLMDGLRRRLKRMSQDEVARVLPRDAWLLARLFPVLRVVVPEDEAPHEVLDPLELRMRAVEVSSELLRNLCRERPVVVFLDDVQWGDADSARILAGWLKHLQHSRLLIVLAYRAEDEAASPLLSSLTADPAWARSERRVLELEPLSLALATAVARGMIGDEVPNPTEAAVWIAEQSGGNPHLLTELTVAFRSSVELGLDPVRQGLNELLRARLATLTPEAQRLLRIVAVAGQPLPVRIVSRAAQLEQGALAAVSLLRAQRLVRTNQNFLGELVEPYHTRVGRSVQDACTPAELARLHERLARAMEAEQWDDAEALMQHWLAAGAQDRAGELALRAARHATETLAFDKAARLYQLALELGRWGPVSTVADGGVALLATEEEIRVLLADALVYAGRGEQAARVYLEAARGADPGTAIAMRRKAAEQLISNGYLDEGMVLLREVLAAVGLKLPASTPMAALGSLGHRLCLTVRGRHFQERNEADISEAELQRIDTCWFVALALALVDPMLGAYFHERNLLYALKAGERYRVLRALAFELPMIAQSGRDDWARWSNLAKRCKALSSRLGRAHGHALIYLGEGMSAYLEGRFKNAYRLLRQAERTLVELVPGVPMELAAARLYALRALMFTGELRTVGEQHARLLDDATERGNLLLTSNLRSDVFVLLHLAQGHPERARADLASVRSQWSRTGWHYQHLFALRGWVYLALYEGQDATAWREVGARWSDLTGAMLHRNAFVNLTMCDMRGAAALAAGNLREARRISRKLLASKHRLGAPFGHLLLGGIHAAAGEFEPAVQAFEQATDGFDRAEMVLHAQVARRRRGELLGGAEGRQLMRAADGWFANQGVADPVRLCASISPSGKKSG